MFVEKRKKGWLTFAVSRPPETLWSPQQLLEAKCKYHSTDSRLPNQMVPMFWANPCPGVYLNAICRAHLPFNLVQETLNSAAAKAVVREKNALYLVYIFLEKA